MASSINALLYCLIAYYRYDYIMIIVIMIHFLRGRTQKLRFLTSHASLSRYISPCVHRTFANMSRLSASHTHTHTCMHISLCVLHLALLPLSQYCSFTVCVCVIQFASSTNNTFSSHRPVLLRSFCSVLSAACDLSLYSSHHTPLFSFVLYALQRCVSSFVFTVIFAL